MKKIDNRFFIIAFVAVFLFFLYLSSGIMFGSANGMHHNNGWMRHNNWGWFLSVAVLFIFVIIGWLYFKRKD